jgi:putative N6-adenine-specific DNA methylase
MTTAPFLEIFLAAVPGLEAALCDEAKALGFRNPKVVSGGVTLAGNWRDVWRANLELRGASRVLVRIGSFRALHLAQLDKRARQFPWRESLRSDVPLRVEVTCRKSRIYHSGAAAQRIEAALREELRAAIDADANLCIKVRIEDDLCTISIDTSGDTLHRRGHKEEVAKAPMRETMAALFLRQCGFTGNEPVVDPMCGSGTFVIEAAEIAMGLNPGRSRTFAFEELATFDPEVWQKMRDAKVALKPAVRFHGSDRDAGAIRMSKANAKRSGVSGFVEFRQRAITDLAPPEGPPGLVIVNPPYGARIGDRKPLFGLYGAVGKVLRERFSGWRVGLVTSDAALARATGLPFLPAGEPVIHGGLRIRLFRTEILA